jgi:hypothetical protein
MQIDSKALFAEVKANAAKLTACKQHHVDLGEPPYKFGMTCICTNCGGTMKAVDLFRYVQGFEAAGGNPNDVVPGYNPQWEQDPDHYTKEQVSELVYRFACILEHATGGKMSKTNYTLEAMRAVVDDHITETCEAYLKEFKEPANEEQAEGVLQRQHSNVKEAHDRIYDLLLGDDPQAIKEGRAYLQREAPTLAAMLAVVNPERTFEQAWKAFTDAGYRYGRDALEGVRFGWEIAHGRKPR